MTVIFSCNCFFSPKCAFDGPGWLMFAVMENGFWYKQANEVKELFTHRIVAWRQLVSAWDAVGYSQNPQQHFRECSMVIGPNVRRLTQDDVWSWGSGEVGVCSKAKLPFLQLDCFQSAVPLVSSPQRKAVQLEGSQCNDAEWENPGLDCAFKICQRAFHQLCLWSRVQTGEAVQLTARKIALHVP